MKGVQSWKIVHLIMWGYPFLILLFSGNHFIKSGTSSSTFGLGLRAVKFLEAVPTISKDPLTEIATFTDKIFDTIGVRKVLNGDPRNNLGRVEVPVRVTRPSLQNVKFYYLYTLAILCESSLERWDCHYCNLIGKHINVVAVMPNSKYHTKSLITTDSQRQTIVVSFRAVYNIGSILTALHAKLDEFEDDKSIKIHSGFLKSVKAEYGKIVRHLRRLTGAHPNYKVVITGHSLGGQQASILLFLFKYWNPFPDTEFELYTFGQARTGNKAYANFLNNLTIPMVRVVNQDDVVPRVAPAALGYYHHHNELLLKDDIYGTTTAHYCSTDFYEDPNCGQARGFSRILAQAFIFPIDHLVYFGRDPGKCVFENPSEFLLQYFGELRSYIPLPLLEQFPKFSANTSVFLELRQFIKTGVRNLYNLASKSSTYS